MKISGVSIVVEHLPHHPKVLGLIPANVVGNRRTGNGFGSLGQAQPSWALLNTPAYLTKSYLFYQNISQD
jgi:hypothetical protein